MFFGEPVVREYFDDVLLQKYHGSTPLPVAVVWPCDRVSLEGAVLAAQAGVIRPTLVGAAEQIQLIAQENAFDLTGLEIVDVWLETEAAEVSARMAAEGKVKALMKGSLHTNDLMRAIVARNGNLRTSRRMSHVFALDHPHYHKLLLISDAALNIAPGLMEKRDITQNAIDLAHALGVATPKVAILAAVETIEENIESTLHAAALCKMGDRRQIRGALLDGPLALDNALSREAARIKGIRSEVAGDADILVVPNYEAGNMLAKDMEHMGGARAAGLVLGARVPVILTSRADSPRTRLASCLLARAVVEKG